YSESDLISACINHERWAQKILYEEHYGKLMAICLRYSNNEDDALDLLHEGFIKIFTQLHKYQQETSLGAWMKRVVVNNCIDYYRKHARKRTEELDNAHELLSLDADAVSQYSEKEILAAIQNLPPAYRAIFNLYVIEGYSHKEISEQLHITESTSRSNLVKARLKLKKFLTGK
ncbi:MAG: RNA polymerase sigma factor, partial [Saprospiraceae bacterium]